MLYIINGKIAQHNFLKFPQDINICDGGLMFFIVFQWMILSKNLYLKGKINSLKPVDTKKWQVVTPVYFSGGLTAALLHAEVGGTGGLACVVVAHVNMHSFRPYFCLSSLTISKFFSRQLVAVVQSDRRGQRSVVNQSCIEHFHLLILHGW